MLRFLNPLFRLWGPHFCVQDPPISLKDPYVSLTGRKQHSAIYPLTWINWMVKADFPTPPPPTTTRRYFSCTEPSFQPAIGDTLLLSLRCLNTRSPSHFTPWQAFRWRNAAGKCEAVFGRGVNSTIIPAWWEKYDHGQWEMHSESIRPRLNRWQALTVYVCLSVMRGISSVCTHIWRQGALLAITARVWWKLLVEYVIDVPQGCNQIS